MKRALLLLPIFLAPTAAAQEPPAPAPDVVPVPTEEARFIKHLLTLQDGRILRVKAREVSTGWEIREKGAATSVLPASIVTRAVLVKDVLAESRRLAKEVGKKDPVRRVALAEWMFSQGLYEEGIKELNPILAKAPDQPQALSLIKRDEPPLALPPLAAEADTLGTYLRKVAGAKPVSKEVAINRLGTLHGTIDLKATLRSELAQASVKRRSFAAHAMRRLFPGEEIKAMLNRAVLDGSADVRQQASFALRDAKEPAVILPILRALGSSSSAVRKNAAEALGNTGYGHGVEPLFNHLMAVNTIAAQSGGGYSAPASHIFSGRQIAYVQDYDVEVAQFAAIADPTINTLMEGSVLDVRVLAVSQTQIASEKAAIRTALANLTGADPGHTTRAWTNWWEENGNEWTASLGKPDSPSTPTSPER